MNGPAARANGRISSRTIGVPSRASGSTSAFASSSLRNGGRSAFSAGCIVSLRRSSLASAVRLSRSVPGQPRDEPGQVLLLVGERAERLLGRAHEPLDVLAPVPSSVIRSP